MTNDAHAAAARTPQGGQVLRSGNDKDGIAGFIRVVRDRDAAPFQSCLESLPE
jgi:hypothetical protein